MISAVPQGIHKADEACDDLPVGTRPKNHYLSGRLADNEPVISGTSSTGGPGSVTVGVSAFPHQQGEIPVSILSADPFPGFLSGLSDHEVISSQRKDQADCLDVSEPSDSTGSIPQESLSTAELLGKMCVTTQAIYS